MDLAIEVALMAAGTKRNERLNHLHTMVNDLAHYGHAPSPGTVFAYRHLRDMAAGATVSMSRLRLFAAEYENKAFRATVRINTSQRIMLEALRVRRKLNTEGEVLQALLSEAYAGGCECGAITPLEDENARETVLAQEKRKAS